MILEYWRFSESYYRRADGKPTGELDAIRKALQPARELYASFPASEFSSKCLKVVRDTMISKRWTHKNINNQVGRIKCLFRWGVGEDMISGNVFHAEFHPTHDRSQDEEMLGGDVYHALQTGAGLKLGR